MTAQLVSRVAVALVVSAVSVSAAGSQTSASQSRSNPPAAMPSGAPIPAGYVIGPEDVLTVIFWRERDMSVDVVVRPDGRISVPLIDDVQAAGYTPEQLNAVIEKAAAKYVSDPNATVVVKEIHSRKVFVVGQVARPGTYPLASNMNVLQLIAVAGGLLDYADQEHITLVRDENGREQRLRFNYSQVVRGKKVEQNVSLKPGDTLVVR